MYTGLAAAIVTALQAQGFTARQLGAGVLVSLNWPVSTLEVQTALDQAGFQGSYVFERVNGMVMVTER